MRLLAACAILVVLPAHISAQTRTVRQTATAYGARLNADAAPADLNQKRLNSRLNTRVNNRLATRIERYRVGSDADPVAALRTQTSDGSRAAPVITPARPADEDAPQ